MKKKMNSIKIKQSGSNFEIGNIETISKERSLTDITKHPFTDLMYEEEIYQKSKYISDLEFNRLEYTTELNERITSTNGKQEIVTLIYEYVFCFSLKYKGEEYKLNFTHPSNQIQLNWFQEFENYIAMIILDDELETKQGGKERKTKI